MESIDKNNRQLIGRAYVEVQNTLYAIFRQACIQEDICEDLVQEVFLKILGLDIIIEDQLKALAVKIAYQKRTDYLRHLAFLKRTSKNICRDANEFSDSNDVETQEILAIEERSISRMGETDKKIYRLTRFEEKTAAEISIALNISKRAVESRLYRARTKVREEVRMAIG